MPELFGYRDREPARLKRHGPAPKSPPPLRRREPDYAVKLSTRPVTALERDYNDVIDRYPRLYVSADFAKIVSAWVQVNARLPEGAPSAIAGCISAVLCEDSSQNC